MKTRQLCVRLRSIGLNKDLASGIIDSFTKWVRCSGPEWTVDRLKQLKVAYLHHLAGEPFNIPNVKVNRDGLPCGPWSTLFKGTSEKSVNRTLQVLMIYSSQVSSTITKKQEQKFFGSMQSEDVTGLASELKLVPRFPLGSGNRQHFSSWDYRKHWKIKMPIIMPFLTKCTSRSKSAPSCLGPSIRNDDALGQLLFFAQSIPGWTGFHKFPEVFKGVIPEPLLWKLESIHEIPQELACVQSIGKLGFIQEPGCKLRAVANPNSVWQAALDPLKKLILMDLKYNFPEDCTHDQLAGVQDIKGWLSRGRVCHSVDLSDATNLMPRHLQIEVLRKRYLSHQDQSPFDSMVTESYYSQLISAFDWASAQPWYYKKKDGSFSNATFTRGQPLGFGPSFPTFALTHNIIMDGLCKKVGVDPNDTYRILGDDIVIANDAVHRLYLSTLRNLGCKISVSKCIDSDKVAEFAGKVITRNRIYTPYKWKDVSMANLVDFAKNFGMNSRRLLAPGYQRWIVDKLGEIPESFGGLGWNPRGLSEWDRVLASPAADWLISRYSNNSSNESCLVLYKTLTSLLQAFNKQVSEFSWIEPYTTGESDSMWARFAPRFATSKSILGQWQNDVILKDLQSAENRRNAQLPEMNLIWKVVPNDDRFGIKEDPYYGILLPVQDTDQIGDPRLVRQVNLLELLNQLSLSKEDRKNLKLVNSAFYSKEPMKNLPSFYELTMKNEYVSSSHTIHQVHSKTSDSLCVERPSSETRASQQRSEEVEDEPVKVRRSFHR